MKKNTCILFLLCSVMLISCNDFFNIEPKDKLTTTTSFKTYANFQTYSWGLYEIFMPVQKMLGTKILSLI